MNIVDDGDYYFWIFSFASLPWLFFVFVNVYCLANWCRARTNYEKVDAVLVESGDENENANV